MTITEFNFICGIFPHEAFVENVFITMRFRILNVKIWKFWFC